MDKSSAVSGLLISRLSNLRALTLNQVEYLPSVVALVGLPELEAITTRWKITVSGLNLLTFRIDDYPGRGGYSAAYEHGSVYAEGWTVVRLRLGTSFFCHATLLIESTCRVQPNLTPSCEDLIKGQNACRRCLTSSSELLVEI